MVAAGAGALAAGAGVVAGWAATALEALGVSVASGAAVAAAGLADGSAVGVGDALAELVGIGEKVGWAVAAGETSGATASCGAGVGATGCACGAQPVMTIARVRTATAARRDDLTGSGGGAGRRGCLGPVIAHLCFVTWTTTAASGTVREPDMAVGNICGGL
ncbi:MAG: hypothetical protein NVS9B6_01990 [Candidatus Limnocylindrales bacterium]